MARDKILVKVQFIKYETFRKDKIPKTRKDLYKLAKPNGMINSIITDSKIYQQKTQYTM